MKRVLGVAVPVMLLFGCGVGEKDSIPKTEETSKQDKKKKYQKKSILTT